MARLQDVDQRRYVIRSRENEYFIGWRGTDWETVKRTALWTRDKSKALVMSLGDLPKNGYLELVCGFTGLKLELLK